MARDRVGAEGAVTTSTTSTTGRAVLGVAAALASIVALAAVMLPLRDHLSIATTALVLVVPVVVGVATGGFRAGLVSVIAGFLVNDYFFIPPYMTLKVGATENWTALAVYVVVMVPIARLVDRVVAARGQAQQRGEQLRRLLDVSGLLIEDRPLPELLGTVVTTLCDLYQARQVVLLLPRLDRLEIAASAGEPLTDDDRARIEVSLGQLSSLAAARGEYGDPLRLALVAAGRPTGLLAISGAHITDRQREPLFLFADQAALAVERAQLREQALRAELTDEVERLASTLVAAVSHDLRTPLASIKAASSILADPLLAADVDPDARQELMTSIDAQADRLAVMVANLLDMGRIQAGVLQPRTTLIAVEDLIHAALGSLAATYPSSAPTVELVEPLPLVEADAVLISRVLANLLDNAYRHTPKNTPVRVTARLTDPRTVTVSVTATTSPFASAALAG